MARPTIRLPDTRRLQSTLDRLSILSRKPSFVKVGLPKDSVNYPDGTSIIMVGAVNEFGSRDGKIPERSYLRSTSKELTPKIKRFWRKNAFRMLIGRLDSQTMLGLIGAQFQDAAQQKITDIKEPGLAPSTIARRLQKVANVGGDVTSANAVNPLVDTGHLRQSIRYEISEDVD